MPFEVAFETYPGPDGPVQHAEVPWVERFVRRVREALPATAPPPAGLRVHAAASAVTPGGAGGD